MNKKLGTQSSSRGISGTTALQLLFIGLKLAGIINWSWWWVLSPMLITVLMIVILVVVFVLYHNKVNGNE